MGTIRDYTGSQVRRTHDASYLPLAFPLFNQLNCAVDNQASGDVAQMLDMKEGYEVLSIVVQVVTPEGSTLTFDVGETGGDVDAWIDGVNGNSAGWYRSGMSKVASTTNADLDMGAPTQLFGIPGGKLYTGDDTIDVVFNDAAAACLFRIIAWIFDNARLGPAL